MHRRAYNYRHKRVRPHARRSANNRTRTHIEIKAAHACFDSHQIQRPCRCASTPMSTARLCVRARVCVCLRTYTHILAHPKHARAPTRTHKTTNTHSRLRTILRARTQKRVHTPKTSFFRAAPTQCNNLETATNTNQCTR